jgi:presequence protease
MILKGFELVKSEEIIEVDGEAKLYRHKRTGAELLSIENQDNNKVFAITFKTIPGDSTGVPHILEHTVLCGSRDYPVKDPFLQLLKGSLNTYLNAFTACDHTSYPVASTNQKDFQNLMNVYLDAVFRPLLKEEAFMQEGWRYELDQEQVLKFNGIVFNEMKGAYSEPSGLLYRLIQDTLLPDTIYAFDSGGEPKQIPNLTYADFKRFHETYYHPSNSYIFLYGNFVPDEILSQIDKHLGSFKRQARKINIALQPRFSKPREIKGYYSLSADQMNDGKDNKIFVTVNWLLWERTDLLDEMGLLLLDHILLMLPSSPLKRALIESGLGEGIAVWGLDDSIKENCFSTGLRGVAKDNCEKIPELIFSTLEDLVNDGIPDEDISASLNELEFSLRENNTGSTPQGFSSLRSAMRNWLYDKDPFEELKFEKVLIDLKARLKNDKSYLENLIRKCFLDNYHRTTVILLPDPDKSQREQAAERKYLDDVQTQMTEKELEQVVKNAQRVAEYQQASDDPQALAAIPCLHLSEIEKEIDRIPTQVIEEKGSTVLHHDIFTNKIVYLNIGFDLLNIPPELLPYTHLFGRSLKEMGTTEQDYVAFNRRISSRIGGLQSGNSVQAIYNSDEISGRFYVHGKAVVNRTSDLIEIIQDALFKLNLNNRERFKQIVLESKTGMERQVIGMGHSYVQSRLGAMFDLSSWAAEQLGGLNQLFFLRELVQRLDCDWAQVHADLERFRDCLLRRDNLIVNVTVPEKEFKSEVQPLVNRFISDLKDKPDADVEWEPSLTQVNEALTAPSEVNYVGKGLKLKKPQGRFSGAVGVVMKYLNRSYLWEKIRVQGGAYGAFGSLNYDTGMFVVSSYRDRNLIETLSAFDQLSDHFKNLVLPSEEIDKIKIGTISSIDAHLLPDAKGRVALSRHLCKISDEIRQQYRDEVFAATIKDFHDFGNQLQELKDQGYVAVLGSAERLKGLGNQIGKDFSVVSVL